MFRKKWETLLDDDIRNTFLSFPSSGDDHGPPSITHTSGLREFLNLLLMSGRQLGQVITSVEKNLLRSLKISLPSRISGSEWNYNNTAFGLAAVIVERTSGQGFHEFMAETFSVRLA
ncbi:MAG: hypothetical protein Ct9H300mP15_20440 [Gemmatimonadota bacterium]|nr:MAG: hypothetical protein Ct9H300mP15_20440 [Gemmatimonadota bacterium]